MSTPSLDRRARRFRSVVWNSGPRDHLEAHVAEGRGDEIGAAVVAVLPHLGDEDARRAAEAAGDGLRRRRPPAPSARRPA